MTITAPTAATQPAAITPTVKTDMRSIAAAVALAAGSLLFAAPAADAKPPREVEDQIANMRADCGNANGTWARASGQFIPRDRYYSCLRYTAATSTTGKWETQWYSSTGTPTQVCYRFSIDTAWVCQ